MIALAASRSVRARDLVGGSGPLASSPLIRLALRWLNRYIPRWQCIGDSRGRAHTPGVSTMKKALVPSIALIAVLATLPASAQEAEQPALQITVEPASLTLPLGETATLTATVKDADGNDVDRPVVFLSLSRRAMTVNAATGEVQAYEPGEYEILARVPPMTPMAGVGPWRPGRQRRRRAAHPGNDPLPAGRRDRSSEHAGQLLPGHDDPPGDRALGRPRGRAHRHRGEPDEQLVDPRGDRPRPAQDGRYRNRDAHGERRGCDRDTRDSHRRESDGNGAARRRPDHGAHRRRDQLRRHRPRHE